MANARQPQALTYAHRLKIESMLKEGRTVRDIALELGFDPSVISRELVSTTLAVPRALLYRADFAHTLSIVRKKNRAYKEAAEPGDYYDYLDLVEHGDELFQGLEIDESPPLRRDGLS